MKKYGDLIQFESVTATIQLKNSSDYNKAVGLVSSYVISDKMAIKLSNIIIEQLQYEKPVDNKALWVVGNYGSGKSHLMSVISAVAEHADLTRFLTNEKVRCAAEKIAGKFKVIRFEIGASKMALADIITRNLTSSLAEMGVEYHFPPMTEIASNHKPYFAEMMDLFHQKYPDHGLLLVCDEVLDYFRSRNEQELPLDIAILRVIGEVIDGTRFRFMAGVQEAIFDSTQLEFLSREIKRIRDRAEQVIIAREDIKYVVAERLLKKTTHQQAWIRAYLQPFTPYYEQMNERLDEFVRMFPVHPDYINTFERVRIAGLENRQVLKSLSRQMNELMQEEVPQERLGLFSYDTYWNELISEPSMKTNPEVGLVIDVGQLLIDRIDQAYPTAGEKAFAKRLVAGLAIHRMAVGDLYAEMGATAAELRDSLCLYLKNIEILPGNKSKNLENHIIAVLTKIRRTVNGQFFSKNKENDQFYLDLKRTEDFDAHIEAKAAVLAADHLNSAYRAAMREILEQSDKQLAKTAGWQHELEWAEKNTTRAGWLILGSPNERETAGPRLDYSVYFIQPENPPRQKKASMCEDEVYFILRNRSEEFTHALKYYAASVALRAQATGTAQQAYRLKAEGYLADLISWIQTNVEHAFDVQYNGICKSLHEWRKSVTLQNASRLTESGRASARELIEAVAAALLSDYFHALAPEYPHFSQKISGEALPAACQQTLNYLAGGAPDKRTLAVLNALELFDGDKFAPAQSRYARSVLNIVAAKGPGQVVNFSELLESAGHRLFFKPGLYRLEPEWLIVILISLVQTGELELSIAGKGVITASNLELLKTLDVNRLINFDYIQAPKDFNVTAIKSLLSLLGMDERLAAKIQQGDGDVVRQMEQNVERVVDALIQDQQAVRQRLMLWDNHVLSEHESALLAERLGETKVFLESVQRLNTPGKLKNFKESLATIERHQEILQEWREFRRLSEIVDALSEYTQYLSGAQLVLDEKDPWQDEAQAVAQQLTKELRDKARRLDKNVVQSMQAKLMLLIRSYQQRYSALYLTTRLSADQNEQKLALLNDQRLAILEAISAISLLPASQIKQWRDELNSLQWAEPLDAQKLALTPNPVNFSPRIERVGTPISQRLEQLDKQLDSLLDKWTRSLQAALQDCTVRLDQLTDAQQSTISQFIESGRLFSPVNEAFVEGVNTLLSGLKQVKITTAELAEGLGKGMPQTIDDIRAQFEKLLTEHCQGKDSSKVRIIIE